MMPKTSKKNIDLFDKSEIGKIKNTHLKRVKIYGIVAITSSLVWFILNIYNKVSWYEYISPALLILFGIYFIINSNIIKIKEVNKFIYNKKASK